MGFSIRRHCTQLLLLAVLLAAALAPSAATAASNPQQKLARALTNGLKQAGSVTGAYAVDLTTGKTLFSERASTPRLPASVEKLYTTSTALLKLGPNANLLTRVYAVGTFSSNGTFTGTLYLRGGGDPTFGAAGFDRYYYGTGATVQRLVANLIRDTGIRALNGRIVGDESYFDALRGTVATDFESSAYVEGQLSGLAYDRGFTSTSEVAFQPHPALFAAQQFADALRAARVRVPDSTPIYTGDTPRGARQLADVHSPRLSKLLKLTNTPSDNFFAEMLIKDLGARFGGAGTTAAGAAVVRAQIANSFAIHPQLDDGSGLSYGDATSPEQVVTLLKDMADNAYFMSSLAVAGESGTLVDEMRGTYAQGRCRGKTGTLEAVSNLVGYCTARDGNLIAFAFLMNDIDPDYAHPIQDQMALALADYDAEDTETAPAPSKGGGVPP
ncbi:MAG TPA: D-alanyl-D-alanine carboxypeptidase/D-alanyl-D-alanine-endopeptidase [Solirubrobacteraceae bacterium]|nr:D-alanyl-D-alanine carboxypeptidase/D-alanyl-D-alanine-endopeptidase [Solirubrobacteraceae bacterium]